MQSQKLELRQGQSLVMTAQLQQSIKLLQLSSLELSEFIEQELEKNPLLTLEEGEPQDAQADADDAREATQDEPSAASGEGEEDGAVASTSNRVDDGDWTAGEMSDETLLGSGEYGYRSGGGGYDGEGYDFDQLAGRTLTLREHLLDQLYVDVTDPTQRMLGMHLIDLVDDNGYIKEDMGLLADRLGCDVAEINDVLQLLQRFDPPGVCARDVAECISIQLREKNRFDPAMELLVANIDRLAKGEYDTLRKLCEVDADDFTQMLQEIRALNPKPGAQFSSDMAQSVEPDIFLKKVPSGAWQVELNSATLPRVLVNQRYCAQLTGKTLDKQEKKYISDQLAYANWLVKALEQRAHTILRVSTEIVAQQSGFFDHGIRYFKPLTLKDIALAVDMHESTVSRVTTNKYMATPRGIFELKYFFASSLQNNDGGDDFSSKTVQFMIKELVDAESPKAILSDDAIASLLKEKGIEVARRTITKYREAMHIPASALRRREKNRR